MSDAMTNREIEDVLTSIRRLVAQEGSRPADAGRLVLTEDQRVSVMMPVAPGAESETGPEAGEEGAMQGTDPARSARGVRGGATPHDLSLPEPDFGKLEATIAELEAAVSASGETWESETGSDEPPRPSNVTDLYGRLSFVHRSKDSGDAPARDAPHETGSDAQAQGETDGTAGSASWPAHATDAIPSAIPGTMAGPEPEAGAAHEPAQEPVDPAGLAGEVGLVGAPARTAPAPEARGESVEDRSATAAAAPVAGTDGARDTAPDPETAEEPGRRQGAGDAPDLQATDTTAPADAALSALARERAAPDPAWTWVGDRRESDGQGPVEDAEIIEGDTVLDEAALKALVAQIVREELHGQLGERVTQQVRKLVRAEIAKALDDRNFL